MAKCDRYWGRLLAACLAAGVSAASAAATDADTGADAGSDERRVLEEVVVTAQKTAQSSQDVPISLSAIGGEFMQEVGASGLQDIAAYIPNLQFSSDDDPALAQINIRGFGSNPLNAAFESSVGFVLDEVYLGRSTYYSDGMFDIDRVEVLRGPQGTLFGKNTIAGVFNVVSAAPGEDFSGSLRASRADPREHRIEAGVGGMFAPWGGLRLSALKQERDGELHNTFLQRNDDEMEQSALRLKLVLAPVDALSVELTALESDTSANYWRLQLMELDEDTRDFLDDYDPAVEGDPTNYQSSYDTPGFIDKGSTTVSLKTDWAYRDQHNAVLVLADSDLDIDSLVDLDVSPADIGRLAVVSNYEQQSAELRFTGSFDGLFGLGQRLDYVLGGYYFESRFAQRATIAAGEDFGAYLLTDDVVQLASKDGSFSSGGLIGSLRGLGMLGGLVGGAIGEDFYQLDYLLDVEATAWFGQFSWYLNERWVITPGVRVNREDKRADAFGSGFCEGKALGQPCIMATALSAEDYAARDIERSERDVSPKLTLQYYFNEDVNVFASYARGFKSGGFNASSFSGDDLDFEPEQAVTMEIGTKGQFFDNTLRVNATLYRTEFDDLQVLAFNGAFFDVTNAASAISEGAELDFNWLTPWPVLSVSGSLGYLDARYDSYPNAPAPVSDGINTTQDLAGERIALAPESSASLTPTLTVPLFGLGLRASVDLLYQGDQYTDTDLDENSFIPGFATVSARLSIGHPDQLWAITVGGSNLTDERELSQVVDAVFFPGSYNARQKGSRKIFAALSLRW